MTYLELEQALTTWALAQPDMPAGVVVGSRARAAHLADDWSDLDVILFTLNPAHYVANSDWLGVFGPIWLAVLEQAGANPEWQVVYLGGLKVDIVLAAVEPGATSLTALLVESPHRVVFEPGNWGAV